MAKGARLYSASVTKLAAGTVMKTASQSQADSRTTRSNFINRRITTNAAGPIR